MTYEVSRRLRGMANITPMECGWINAKSHMVKGENWLLYAEDLCLCVEIRAVTSI